MAAGVADEVRQHFKDQVLRTSIPRSVRVSEAPSYGQTVMTYDPGSPGALSYLEAARDAKADLVGHRRQHRCPGEVLRQQRCSSVIESPQFTPVGQ